MKRFFACFLAVFLIFAGGCAPEKYSTDFFAMDTVMSVTVYGNEDAAELCENEAYRLERLLSVTKEGSALSALNRGEEADEECISLVSEALEWAEKTGGAFDPTCLPLTNAWGFLDDEQHVPAPEKIAAVLEVCGYEKVSTDGGITLPVSGGIDLGGIAKGYAARRMKEILTDAGVESGLLYLGGNIQLIGGNIEGENWRVAVQDPTGEGYAVILGLKDVCIATSGAYQRNFTAGGKTYHHIMDPKTGYPAESGLASVTVICPDGVMADALSTALFVMGAEKAEEFWRDRGGFEMVLITEGGELFLTEGIADTCEKQSYDINILEK